MFSSKTYTPFQEKQGNDEGLLGLMWLTATQKQTFNRLEAMFFCRESSAVFLGDRYNPK
jgi:hypothetical protein